MRGTLLTIGIILLVLGIIGLWAQYYVTWMWVLIVLGAIGVIWGWLTKAEIE